MSNMLYFSLFEEHGDIDKVVEKNAIDNYFIEIAQEKFLQ